MRFGRTAKVSGLLAVVAALAAGISWAVVTDSPGRVPLPIDDGDFVTIEPSDGGPEVEIDLRRFRQVISRDVIRPIYEPEFVQGTPDALDPEELVMGVEINGESKAYPVGPLNYREMVNDVVGGVPILVTW